MGKLYTYQEFQEKRNEANAKRIKRYAVKYRAENKGLIKTRDARAHLKYYAKRHIRMRQLLKGARSRAAAKSMVFDPRLFEVMMQDPPSHCDCCGKALDYSMGRGVNNNDDSPSMDRVDNRIGYSMQNTRVICMRCNMIKGKAGVADLKIVIAYIRRAMPTVDPPSDESASTSEPK